MTNTDITPGLRDAIEACLRAGDSPTRILASARLAMATCVGLGYTQATIAVIERYLAERMAPSRGARMEDS